MVAPKFESSPNVVVLPLSAADSRRESVSSSGDSASVPSRSPSLSASIASLQLEGLSGSGTTTSSVASGSSRRHGRFLVQPLMESVPGSAPSGRASSPSSVGRPPLGPPVKVQSSPAAQTSSSYLGERRPSRIIGRFEVCELFPQGAADSVASTADNNFPACKSVNLLDDSSDTRSTTPLNESAPTS